MMMDMFVRVGALEAFANHMQITADTLGNLTANAFRTQSYDSPGGPGDRTIEFTTPYNTYNRDVPPPPERPLAHEKNVYWEHTANVADLPREMERQVLDQRASAADMAVARPLEAESGAIVNLTA